jgi:hypothetical protein
MFVFASPTRMHAHLQFSPHHGIDARGHRAHQFSVALAAQADDLHVHRPVGDRMIRICDRRSLSVLLA